MKRILFIILIGITTISALAKNETNAKNILDKTARVIKAGGDIQVGFN